MVVYVANRAGKKLYCIVDGLDRAGSIAQGTRGPVASFPPIGARSYEVPNFGIKDQVKLRAAGNPSAGATPRKLQAVLIIHGFKGFSTQRHIAAISDSLVSAGFVTIRPDLTKNPGKSYLDFADMTYGQEFNDLGDIFDFVLKMPEVDANRIGITGHSLGGMLVAQLAAKNKRVSSLVLLSAVYDFRFVARRIFKKTFDQVKKDFKEKGASIVWSQSLQKDLLIKKKFYEDVVFRTAADFAKKVTCPTLVISGGKDEAVSQSHADRYLKTIGAKVKKMEIIAGSDHNYTTFGALEQVMRSVTDWFTKTL